MAMFAPALASRLAIALPMPRVPPVISTVLLAKVKTEFRATYDRDSKNWVLPLKRRIGNLRYPGVFHEAGKSGNSALVQSLVGEYICIVSCLI